MFSNINLPLEDYCFCRELFLKRLAARSCSEDIRESITLEFRADFTEGQFQISELPDKTGIMLTSGGRFGMICAIGKLLRTGSYTDGKFTPGGWRGISKPAKPYRVVYLASHFSNILHVAPVEFMEEYIADMALRGYNYLALAAEKHLSTAENGIAEKNIRRVKTLYSIANRYGMKAFFGMSNIGAADTPKELRALPTGRCVYGTEICPSKPEGLALLQKQISAKLDALDGIDVGVVLVWPYDQGGCSCPDCAPYPSNGMVKLAKIIFPEAHKHWPKAKLGFSAWLFDYTSPEGNPEWEALYGLLNSDSPWKPQLIEADSHTDFPRYPLEHPLPGNVELTTFPEISMWGRTPWGGFGATPQPKRFARLWGQVCHIAKGGRIYSEGIFEDFNKALYGDFFWSGSNGTDTTIREYAHYEFGLEDASLMERIVNKLESMHAELHWFPAGQEWGLEAPTEPLPGRPGIVRNHRSWNPDDAEEILGLLHQAEAQMPEWGRRSWRWRLFMLRGILDADLSQHDGVPSSVGEAVLSKLAVINRQLPETHANCAVFTQDWIKAQPWYGR